MNSFRETVKTRSDEVSSIAVTYSGHEKCEPKQRWGKGIREQYILHLIVSGKGTYVTPTGTYQLGKGDIFLIRPYTEIEYYADEDEPWEYYWVNFIGNDVKLLLDRTDFTEEMPYMSGCDEEITNAMEQILTNAGNRSYELMGLTGRLYLLLSLLAKRSSPKTTRTPSEHSRRRSLKAAMNFIHANYPIQISVDDVADFAGVSRTTLFRIFRSELDMTPVDYLIRCRITKAKMLLTDTGLSITAVARSAGYEDNLYFSRAFKKITGISPTEYRASQKLKQKSI